MNILYLGPDKDFVKPVTLKQAEEIAGFELKAIQPGVVLFLGRHAFLIFGAKLC